MSFSDFIGKHYKTILPLSVLFLLILAYSNSFFSEFQFDDEGSIIYNDMIKSFDLYKNINNWLNPNLRIFSLFTFALNYHFHSLDVFGYHLVNFFIHLINTLLIFSVSKIILDIKYAEKDNNFYYAIVVAAIFALHPLQTQAVTYIVQRMTSLCATFYIIGIIAYIKFRINYINKKFISSILWFMLIPISLFLGLGAKQVIISAPILLIAVEFFVIKQYNPNTGKKYRNTLLIGLLFIGLLLFFIPIPKEVSSISRFDYILIQIGHIPRYLQIFLFPYNQTIDHLYPLDKEKFDLHFFLGVIIILLCIITFVKSRNDLIKLGILWYFIGMSVESTLIPIRDTFVEHRLYFPLIGIIFVITGTFRTFIKKEQLLLYSKTIAFLLIVLASLTYVRNIQWKTRISLWTDATEKYPTNHRALNNLGHAYLENNDYNKALANFKMAIMYSNNQRVPINNIGKIYFNLGEKDKAIKYYKIAYNMNRYDAHILNNIAEYYMILKKYDKALEFGKKALDTNIRKDLSYYTLGEIYLHMSDTIKAKEMYKKSISSNPDINQSKKRLKDL
jgi:protein O-mannosyl-transferase